MLQPIDHIEWTPEMDALVTTTYRCKKSITRAADKLGVARMLFCQRGHALGFRAISRPGEWTDFEKKILTEQWEAGLPASQIALMVGKTKNAVIGKAHRLNLSYRSPCGSGMLNVERKGRPGNVAFGSAPKVPRKRAARPKSEMVVARPRKAIAPRFYAAAIPLTTKPPISIMELRLRTCRAVVGVGLDGLATYCGDQVFPEKSFCEGHCALYYRPPEARRAR